MLSIFPGAAADDVELLSTTDDNNSSDFLFLPLVLSLLLSIVIWDSKKSVASEWRPDKKYQVEGEKDLIPTVEVYYVRTSR